MTVENNQKTIITFFGAPGCGKGTLAQCMLNRIPYLKHISLGTICRKYASQNSEIGKKIYALISHGNLVTLDIIEYIVKDIIDDFIKDNKYSILLFDGYPRNFEQFDSFYRFYENLYKNKLNYDIIIFQAETEMLKKRLCNRYVCSNNACEKIYSFYDGHELSCCHDCQNPITKRTDDSAEIVEKRLLLYFDEEQSVLNYIKKKMSHQYLCLNANSTVEDLYKILHDYFNKNNIFGLNKK